MLTDILQTVAILLLGVALLAQGGWNMSAQKRMERLEGRVKELGS